MKILWFTSTPCGALQKLTSTTSSCGWLASLENELKKYDEVELSVAFYYKKKIENFVYRGVSYYPIYDDRFETKLKTLLGNYRDLFCGYKNHDMEVLRQLVQEVKPDLIHIHGTELDFGLLQKTVTTVPVVVSIQGVINSCYEKLYSGIPQSIVARYETLLAKLIARPVGMEEKSYRFSAKRELEIMKYTNYVIGRTDYDRHTSLAMSPDRHYFVGNEILREEFYHAKWEKDQFDKELKIVTIISSGIYKGLEVILRTAMNLKRANFPFKWYIVGQDESSRVPRILQRWLDVKFSANKVEFLGSKNAQEIVDVLKSADIYCQTGHIENSPNSVCEAMMLGMPVIASYAGGTCSMLEHNKEGYLLQDGDSYSLAGTIIETAQHFEKAKMWGIAARERALKRHNPQQVGAEYLRIYKQVLELTTI